MRPLTERPDPKIGPLLALVALLGLASCPPGPTPTPTPVTPTPTPTATPTPAPTPEPPYPFQIAYAFCDGRRFEQATQKPHLIRECTDRVTATYIGVYEQITSVDNFDSGEAIAAMAPYLTQAKGLGLNIVAPLTLNLPPPAGTRAAGPREEYKAIETMHGVRFERAGMRSFGVGVDDPMIRPQLAAYKDAGVWDQVFVVMLGDEEPLLKEEMEARVFHVETQEDALGLTHKCLGATFTADQIRNGTGHLADNLCAVYIEAYVDPPGSYWPTANADAVVATLNDLLMRIPVDKRVGIWQQAYDRNGKWQYAAALASLQWTTAQWVQAHRDRVMELRYFAYVRAGGTRDYPELVAQHQRAYTYYLSGGATDPGPQPPPTAGQLTHIDIQLRYKAGQGDYPGLKAPVKGGVVLVMLVPKDKANAVLMPNTPVLGLWHSRIVIEGEGRRVVFEPDASGGKPHCVITGENAFFKAADTSEGHDGNYQSGLGLGVVIQLTQDTPVGMRLTVSAEIKGVASEVAVTAPVVAP
jgi:hypothetical protein